MRANSLDIQQLEIDGQGASGGVNNNLLINGGFNVFQRAISATDPDSTNEYNTMDRWRIRRSYSDPCTVGKSTIAPPGSAHSLYLKRPSGDTDTGTYQVLQQVESYIVRAVRGEYLTISFQIRANAEWITDWGTSGVDIVTGTTIDESITIGDFSPTGAVDILDNGTTPTPAVADTWETVTMVSTLPVPVDAECLAIRLKFGVTGTASADNFLRIGTVKLEVGSVATTFVARPLTEELVLCQRYYHEYGWATYSPIGAARCSSSGTIMLGPRIPFLVQMRVAPTVTEKTSAGVTVAVKADTQVSTSTNVGGLTAVVSTSSFTPSSPIGGTNGDLYGLFTQTPAPQLAFDAEL